MRKLLVILGIISCYICLCPAVSAKTFYLKNGEEIECQSYRRVGNTMLVHVYDDVEIEFSVNEVDLKKTAKGNSAKAKTDKKRIAPKSNVDESGGTSAMPQKSERKERPFAIEMAPDGFQAGTPELQKVLTIAYEKFSRAAQSGDFNETASHMTQDHGRRTLEALAKINDQQELERRRKNMQSLPARDISVQSSYISPDGKQAALVAKGKKDNDDVLRETIVTIMFEKEATGWKFKNQASNYKRKSP